MRTRRQGILTTKRQNAVWCQPESPMFYTHRSHFGYAVQLLPERGFSYRACDEEMPKPQLVLTLLKMLISMVYQSINIVYLIDSINLILVKQLHLNV